MPLKLRPTGLGSGSTRTGLTTASTVADGRSGAFTRNPAIEQGGCPGRGSRTRGEARVRPSNTPPAPKVPSSYGAPVQFFEVSFFFSAPLPAASSNPFRWGSMADRAVSSAATPAATAASLATRFSFDVLGRMDFFDFVGRLVFVCLQVFDLAATRFELVFDLARRFDEVLDLARFFAFFMISPVRFD